MDWQQKTGEDSYFLAGDRWCERKSRIVFIWVQIIGAVYYPKDGPVYCTRAYERGGGAFAHSASIFGR